jgi:4-hydroxy-2-oxoheptanedioate aldolase
VDVIFVGPGDLAVSLGVAPGSEPHTAAIAGVLKTARDAGKACGIFCLTAADMPRCVEAGVRFFLIGGDLGLLGEAGFE